MRTIILPLTLLLPLTALADPIKQADGNPVPLTVSSSAFTANQPIPAEYTCDGTGNPPPLSWSNVPSAAKSVAVLVEDPDAPSGTFTHWLVTDISPTTTSLDKTLPGGAMAASKGKGANGYTPPCPPSGRHRYNFQVFALDLPKVKAHTRAAFLSEINGHIVAKGELTGTYEKRR